MNVQGRAAMRTCSDVRPPCAAAGVRARSGTARRAGDDQPLPATSATPLCHVRPLQHLKVAEDMQHG